jgi:nucleotide-binding universal stress UspA family protein
MGAASVKQQRLVVGVDGSKGARAALRWAVASAADQDGDSILAVAAWQREPTAGTSSHGKKNERAEKVAAMLAAEVAAIPADQVSGTKITTSVSEGQPGDVLADACQDADLLVLGRQGHGKAWQMIFGSTSEECVRKVDCPVVIVTPPPKGK